MMNMLKKRFAALRDSRGFTLVEMMVVVVILALVFTMAYQFFSFSGNMLQRSDKLGDKQNEARLIIQGLRKDFGTALTVGVVSTADPDSFTVASGSYAVYVKNGQLTRKNSAGTTETVYSVNTVDYLAIQFSSTTPGILHIAVTVEGVILEETDVNTLNTTVKTDTASGFASSGNLVVYQPSA